jgi:hypothetical protein
VDIFLRGFSLSNCPQHSLKVLLLLNPMCLLKYVLSCEYNFSFFIFRSVLSYIRINCNRISEFYWNVLCLKYLWGRVIIRELSTYRYFIIRKLLHLISNKRRDPKSPCRRSRWTRRPFLPLRCLLKLLRTLSEV